MSGWVTSLGPGQAPFRLDRRDGLAERSGDHAPNLPPFSRFHEIRIAPFRQDHGVGECVDGLGRLSDHPLLVIRRQAIAEANAQIVEQFDDIHRLMIERLGRLGPVVRVVPRSNRPAPLMGDCQGLGVVCTGSPDLGGGPRSPTSARSQSLAM